MRKPPAHIRDLISIQSTSFFTVVFACLARALPIYQKNPARPPVAGPENIECSAAIVVLITALESHVNRLMFFDSKGLSTNDDLLKKLRTYLPQRKNGALLNRFEEVTACRDAIAHAHVWLEHRQLSHDWKLRDQSWEVAKVTHLRGKARRNTLKGVPITKRLGLNVVPTRVDFVDVVKALIVVVRVMRELERRHGNPKAWLGPFPNDPELAEIFLVRQERDDWEDWVQGTLRLLHSQHLDDVIRRLNLRNFRGQDIPIGARG